jgi:ribosomal protein S18 acetylase RimI-like enzyme
MGVAPGLWNHGVGHALIRGIDDVMRRKRIATLHTQVEWTNHRLLEFFDHVGFKLAPRQVIARPIDGSPAGPALTNAAAASETAPSEVDFSVVSPDFAPLSRDRIPVRTLGENHLDDLVRIDRKVTGLDRRDYLERKMREVLQESGVRLSQVAELDGAPVGFVMAKVDYGEFGQTEPAAVIDTIAVNPDYAGRGVGSALLSQLFANLQALRVEQVETEVARENFDLLGYLYHLGFEPSQRLPLSRTLG